MLVRSRARGVRNQVVPRLAWDASGALRCVATLYAINAAVQSLAILQHPCPEEHLVAKTRQGGAVLLESDAAKWLSKEVRLPMLSSLLTYLGLIVPSAINSQILSSRRWMCFDLAWLTGSWARQLDYAGAVHAQLSWAWRWKVQFGQQTTQVDCLACSKGACHNVGLAHGQRNGLLLLHVPGYRSVGQREA
eukprot:6181194-Pleurochrysis_carterae.AAC.1